MSFAAASGNHRVCVLSATFHSAGDIEIGKTEDCLGLEEFITENLHMSDYPGTPGQAGPGWCNDEEHHYYSTAKAAYNSLNEHQKALFVGNSAYAAEFARLSAWAAANKEAFNSSNVLGAIKNVSFIGDSGNSTTLVIILVSTVGVAAMGGYFLFKKKKQN